MRGGFTFRVVAEDPTGRRPPVRSAPFHNNQVLEGWAKFVEGLYSGAKGGPPEIAVVNQDAGLGEADFHDLDTLSTARWTAQTGWNNHTGWTTFELAPHPSAGFERFVYCRRLTGAEPGHPGNFAGVCPLFSTVGGVPAGLTSIGAVAIRVDGALVAQSRVQNTISPNVGVHYYVDVALELEEDL